MSVRYWILEDDRVKGPFAPEELRALPDFCENSLVHPETEEGGWSQASSVPRLSLLFKPQKSGFLPPEPTLRDLTVLGGLLEKTERLEERLGEVQADLGRRDDDLAGLRARLDASALESEELKRLMEGLASRLEPLTGIQEAISGLQRTEVEKGAAIEQLRGSIEALAARLGSMADASHSEEISELKSRMALLQEEMDLLRAQAAPPPESSPVVQEVAAPAPVVEVPVSPPEPEVPPPEEAPAEAQPPAREEEQLASGTALPEAQPPAREEEQLAPYRGGGTAPCLSEGSEARVPGTALPEAQPPAREEEEPVEFPPLPESLPPEPVLPELLASAPEAKPPIYRRTRILLSAVIVLLLLLLGAYFAFREKESPPSEPPPPPIQPAPEPPPVQAAPEPPPPVSAVIPKPAKRKPRPRKAKEKVLTQKQKDEQLKKDIINRIRLRMSGGSPREGLKQEKKTGE